MKKNRQNWLLKGAAVLCGLAVLCFLLENGGFFQRAFDARASEASIQARAVSNGGIEETPDSTLTVLKVVGVSAKDRKYDGTAAVDLEGGELRTEAGESLPEGALVGLDSSKASGTVEDKNASALEKQVTVTGYLLTGENADRYQLMQPEGVTVKISQVAVTPSVGYVADKPYDGTKRAIGDLELSGEIVPGENVTAAGTFSFVTADAGTNKAVNVTNIRLDSPWIANYVLTADSLENVPTNAEITVSGVTGDITRILTELPDPSLTVSEIRPYKEDIREALVSYRALPNGAKLQIEEELVEKLSKLLQKFVKVETSVNHGEAGVSVSASNMKKHLPFYMTAKEFDEEKTIKLVLRVKDKTSSRPDSGKIKDLLKEEKDGRKAGAYFSIDLQKKSGGQTVDLSETLGQIKISLGIPSGIKDGKRYKVVRVHKGTVTKLDTDTENGKVKFQSDRFSTFVIIYEPNSKKETEQKPASSSAGTDYEAIYWNGVTYAIQHAEEGATVAMSAGGYSQIPASVISELKGKNVTLSLKRSNGSVVNLNGNQVKSLVKGVNSYKIEDLPSIFAAQASKKAPSADVKEMPDEKPDTPQESQGMTEEEREKIKAEVKAETKEELSQELAKAEELPAQTEQPGESPKEDARETVSSAVAFAPKTAQLMVIIVCLVMILAVVLILLLLEKKKNSSPDQK